MKRRIKLTEADLVRIIEKVIKEQEDATGEDMIQGISVKKLNPYVLQVLKDESRRFKGIDLLKITAGCYDGTGYWFEPFKSDTWIEDCGGNSLCVDFDDSGKVTYLSHNGKKKTVNVCNMTSRAELKKAFPYMEDYGDIIKKFAKNLGNIKNFSQEELDARDAKGGKGNYLGKFQENRNVGLKLVDDGFDSFKLVKA